MLRTCSEPDLSKLADNNEKETDSASVVSNNTKKTDQLKATNRLARSLEDLEEAIKQIEASGVLFDLF
jgi:hypothetical protein